MGLMPKGLATMAAGFVLAGGSFVIGSGPAFAATGCSAYGPSTCTTTPTIRDGGHPNQPAAHAQTPSTGNGGLAFTGADVAITATAGAGAVAAGGLLVLASRRRRLPATA